ncbi:S-layer homology domain-containing protein [Anaerotignum faecicola]
MKTRILSYLLVFSMILALLPASALAEGESTTTPHITATVKHALDSNGAETGQITAQIEAYLTDTKNQSRTVKPCDIIFLIEQSAFMNTQNDTTQYGQERADILNSMESLLQNLPAPTTDGEHRVAIAGFGRINNSGTSASYSSDSYIPSQHPGTRLSVTQNPSLNTGYYTCENNAPVFHSQSGWTEWDRITDRDDKTTLPQMPEGYLADESYDKVFMSISDAEDVIDVDKMVSWHAGASRMDAGLQITEQLAKIAQAHKANSKDRNLIIFVAASSLPYQNGVGVQNLRPEAAQAAAQKLKDDYGATIFGFGDFRPLTLQSGMSSEEQRTQFNETMAGICGNSNTLDGTPYFKGLSQVHDIDEALNELLIQIDANVNPNAERRHINVENFQEKSTEPTSHTSHTWKELKEKHHILTSSAINETASVDYYRFTGYENGNPQFAATPFRHFELSLSSIDSSDSSGSNDSIQTALSLQPIPPAKTTGTAYGEKAVITITDPVCVDYKWAGRWTPDFNPPDHEHAARGVKHSPTNPEQNETTSDTMKLKFDGWYRLWDDSIDHEGNGKKTWTYDGKKYVAYQDTVYDAFGSDFTLYGRWIPSIDVNFQWIGSVIPEGAELPSTVSLPLSDSGTASFTPAVPSQEGYEFDGWYKDSACTKPYNKSGEALTGNITLYGRWTKIGTKKVTFTVVNGSWNTKSDWYQNNIGNTDADTTTETVTVNVPLRNGKGTLTPDLVPQVDKQDMKPADNYKAPGTWGDKAPDNNADAITEDGTYAYTYTFPEADTYTITYRWVTGTAVPEDAKLPAQQKQKESGDGTKPTFTIAPEPQTAEIGWHFKGWYTANPPIQTDEPIAGEHNFADFADNGTKNLTLYGKWTHDPCTVTFYADYFQPAQGHFNTDDYSISYTVPYGSTLTKEQDTVPTPVTELAHTCYFEGWGDDYKTSLLDTEEEQENTEGEQENTQDKPAAYSEDSTAGTFYTSKAIQDMTIKSDLNFVAQWWPIVTFNANGGDWELMEDRPTERYVPVPANSDHIDALRPPAREGYTFLGWYDSAENTSGEPIDFRTRTFKGAATVYAHWAKNATVTFKIVNGYWSGNTAEDKTVTVVLHPQANGSASGTLDANHVPAIMIPAAGYENTPGHWDVTPNTEENGISGNVTYTYIFGKKHHSSSSKDENKDKDNNKENNKENNKDNNTGETTPTKVPDLLNGSNHFAYVVGYKDGNVRPQGNITRAETAAIFFRLLKEEVRSENLSKHNDFADVTEDSWYNTAVSTMAGMNILKGRTANSFVPQAPITRAEFAAICARFDSGKAEENNSFTDISGHWAEKEIERAATLGWVSGYTDGSFHPDAPITRAEAMTLINRVLCRMPETKSDLLDSMTKWPDNQPGAWYYLAVQEATNSHTYEQKDSKYETWTALTAEPDWSKY